MTATTDSNRITFNSQNGKQSSWGGIEFSGNTNSNGSKGSALKGVDISGAETAVTVISQGILIEDCTFEGNDKSVFLKNTDGVKIVLSTFKDANGGIDTPYETAGYGPHLNTEIESNTFLY